MNPRVSVITPTWQRHDVLLNRCIPSVQAQTYHNFEHIVVSDGPDPELRGLTSVTYLELSEHEEPGYLGARARNAGVGIARGELLAFLDDDNAFRSHHLELLVGLLDANPTADFAYGRMEYSNGQTSIGAYPPQLGQIDSSSFVCRRTTMDLGMWPIPSGYALDWELVSGWIDKGAQCVFTPEITLTYR